MPVNENIYGGMTKAEITEAREKELQLAQQDRIIEQTKEKKNSLESYVYDMRSKVQIQSLNNLFFFLKNWRLNFCRVN